VSRSSDEPSGGASACNGSFSDLGGRGCDVHFAPTSRHGQRGWPCPFGAKNELMHRSNRRLHSITLSARVIIESGSLMPNACAVFALTTSSKRVGRSIGKSAGRAPLNILFTYVAMPRIASSVFGPYVNRNPSFAAQSPQLPTAGIRVVIVNSFIFCRCAKRSRLDTSISPSAR
jgi:hypothetical protein